jgi:CheY-like chemotaxis protein
MGSAAQRASLPTILIVEDEFLPRAMLSDHLQECGFMVFEAGNADEAITMIETGIPIDLVLTRSILFAPLARTSPAQAR